MKPAKQIFSRLMSVMAVIGVVVIIPNLMASAQHEGMTNVNKEAYAAAQQRIDEAIAKLKAVPVPAVIPPTVVKPAPVITPAPAIPSPSTGMRNGIYFWHNSVLNADADNLINKIRSANLGSGQKINEVYLNFSRSTNYAAINTKLHANGLKVIALMGASDWAVPSKWVDMQNTYIPAIKKQLGGAAGFDGVIFDVEPWAGATSATAAWWASSAAPADYDKFITKWKQAIGSAKLYVTIANWHDVHSNQYQKEFLKKIYAGAADYVVIMDYSTSTYVDRIKTEMGYSKPTIIAFETHLQSGVGPTIAFGTLGAVQKAVTDVLKTYPGVDGFAMHDETYLRFY